MLRNYDFGPVVTDQAIDKEPLDRQVQRMLALDPAAIWISTVTTLYPIVKWLCRLIRAASSTLVVLGGAHAPLSSKPSERIMMWLSFGGVMASSPFWP